MLTPGFVVAAIGFTLRIAADGGLVARLKARDRAAIADLVGRHHQSLVGLADSIVRNRALAEEVAQETWMAVIAAIDGFDGRSALSTWIISILINKARTHARREGRLRIVGEVPGDDAPAAAGPMIDPSRFHADGHWAEPPSGLDEIDPERVVAGREMWKHLKAAIDQLPPGQRAVIIMRDVEGRDAAETCAALDLTPENQRLLLHRARARLRDFLERLEGKSFHASLAKA